eukprot:8533333-Pyramimonas_sp.AAC.1
MDDAVVRGPSKASRREAEHTLQTIILLKGSLRGFMATRSRLLAVLGPLGGILEAISGYPVPFWSPSCG